MAKRTAESTIKGFLYQFNKTLITIIEAEEDEIITIEGLIEDIDVLGDCGTIKAIQVKYHESKEKYTDSLIFKPIIQMAETFARNPTDSINYTIFLHIPSESPKRKNLSIETIDAALNTDDKHLKKIVARIPQDFDRKSFVELVKIEFGPSIDELETTVKNALIRKFADSDVETIIYPNAITKIAKLSSMKDESKRQTTKKLLFEHLYKVTATAISKWTLALKNKKEILNNTKKQLASLLNQNSRERYFYFSSDDIDNFNNNIVVFISNYLDKYHIKPSHLKSPVFVIDCEFDSIKDIEHRLFKKGIKANTGLVGDRFEIEEFYREPIVKYEKGTIKEREFDLKLLALLPNPKMVNHKKGDDFYFVCDSIPDYVDTSDMNSFQIGTDNFNELEFVISLRSSYE